jgi:hypothetical protein
MKSGLFLDVVICQCSAVLQLFTSEYQSLLVRWNAFFVLNLRLDVFNGITGFDVQRDSFSSKSFDKDLHEWLRVNVGDFILEKGSVVYPQQQMLIKDIYFRCLIFMLNLT